MTREEVAMICKAMSDANRLRIIEMLTRGEKCGCHLLEELSVSQPTLSHHMKILCDSGVVVGRKEGKWMHYSISPEGAARALRCLQTLTSLEENQTETPCGD